MQKSHKFAHYSMQYGISTWIFVLYSQLQETAISEGDNIGVVQIFILSLLFPSASELRF